MSMVRTEDPARSAGPRSTWTNKTAGSRSPASSGNSNRNSKEPPMSPPLLRVPEEGAGHPVIASVSGGKDSTALILALREAEIPARYVFADTGWEAGSTYRYVELLQ